MSNLMLSCHFLCVWWVDLTQLPAAHSATVPLPLLKKAGQEKQTQAHKLRKGHKDHLPIMITTKPQGTQRKVI